MHFIYPLAKAVELDLAPVPRRRRPRPASEDRDEPSLKKYCSVLLSVSSFDYHSHRNFRCFLSTQGAKGDLDRLTAQWQLRSRNLPPSVLSSRLHRGQLQIRSDAGEMGHGGGEGRCPASVCPTQVGMILSAHPSTPPHPDPIYLTAGSPSDQHYNNMKHAEGNEHLKRTTPKIYHGSRSQVAKVAIVKSRP